MRIYVAQYDGFWGITLVRWKDAVREVCWGSGSIEYSDYGRELRTQPGSVHSNTDGKGYWCSAPENEFRLVQPLDWTPEDWLEEADTLGLKEPANRKAPAGSAPTIIGARESKPTITPQHRHPQGGRDNDRSAHVSLGSSLPSYELPVDNLAESVEEVERRIQVRFDALARNTKQLVNGDIPSLIVSGPPGIGKSYELRKQIKNSSRIPWMEVPNPIEVGEFPEEYCDGLDSDGFVDTISGSISAVGLYQALWYMRKNGLLLIDDCDDVFRTETALNCLKAACDSDPDHRLISWRKDAKWLEDLNIPRTFLFEGQIAFLTNIDFEMAINKGDRSSEHLKALLDRSRYLSLALRTQRDFMIHIRKVASGPSGMLRQAHHLTEAQANIVLDYIDENKSRFYNLSLRLVKQVAEELVMDPHGWRDNIEATKMRTT